MNILQKYNRIIFAIISIPTLIAMAGIAFLIICEVLPKSYPEYDENKGVISEDEAAKNAKKELYNQYISYDHMFVLNSEQQEFVIPVTARTMEKKERWTERYRMKESSVNEVVFENSANNDRFSANGEPQPEKKPDTTYLAAFYNSYFVNLVYENAVKNIHRTLIKERFTGWELNYIRIGSKRYLAFIGTSTDSNDDGYLNDLDNGCFYLYDIDADAMKEVTIPKMEILHYHLMKNTSYLIFDVKDTKRPESHKNERFMYRYDINTGKYEDIIPQEEKKLHLKLIMK